jgi:hypothetical protein
MAGMAGTPSKLGLFSKLLKLRMAKSSLTFPKLLAIGQFWSFPNTLTPSFNPPDDERLAIVRNGPPIGGSSREAAKFKTITRRKTGGDTAVIRKERDFITLRFRKKLDEDLKEAVKNIEDGVLSNLVRDGLRLMLGIRTTKKNEVTESILSLPASFLEDHEVPAQGVEQQAGPQRTNRATGKPLLNTSIKKDGRG